MPDKATKVKVWEQDGWELWREDKRDNHFWTVFTVKRSETRNSPWRVYSGRLSPHSIEFQFKKEGQ